MKKIFVGILGITIIFILVGCGQIKDVKDKITRMNKPDHEKIEDTREILNKVLEHIADTHSELSFRDGQLLDAELGVPRFETVSFSEIEHFSDKDVADGFIVRPMVDVENPHLLIIVEATNKDTSANLMKAMGKVKSDQFTKFKDAGMWTKYLINNNKTLRQGNFVIYVTWERSQDIVKVFECHIG